MSKRTIKAGTYRTLASTNIGKGEAVMLLEEFQAKIRQAQKLFANSVQKQPDAVIGITGIQNASIENVQPLGEGQKAFQIIEGIENASVFLGLDTTQFELNQGMVEEKQQLLKDNFEKNILTGNRIAEELASSTVQAQQLSEMLENNANNLEVRNVIASAAKPRLAIQIEDGLEVVVGGGLAVPKQLSKGEPIGIKNGIVLSITRRGLVKIHVPIEGTSGEFIEFVVNRKSNDFSLLNIARIFQTKVSVVLIIFERVSNSKEQLELLEIENRKQILTELIGKLQLWDDDV